MTASKELLEESEAKLKELIAAEQVASRLRLEYNKLHDQLIKERIRDSLDKEALSEF